MIDVVVVLKAFQEKDSLEYLTCNKIDEGILHLPGSPRLFFAVFLYYYLCHGSGFSAASQQYFARYRILR